MAEFIPNEEIDTFQEFVHYFSKGTRILVEGQQDDQGLCLLRRGRVCVFKNCGDGREQVGTIDAINFFGEMALIMGGPRTATIEASSDDVMVYSFRTPDLNALMSNPKWGSLLISRLCADLKQTSEQLVGLQKEHHQLQKQAEETVRETASVFSVIAEIHQAMVGEAVVTSREWKYLQALDETTHKLLRERLPEIASRVEPVDPAVWKRLRHEHILTDALDEYLTRVARK